MLGQTQQPRSQSGSHRLGMPDRRGSADSDGEPERSCTLANVVTSQVDLQQRMVTTHEAAHLYGCSWRTLLRWSDAGLVPRGMKLGGKRLFNLRAIQSHIAAGCPPVR